MCGIFGYAGISPKKINIDKLNTLGIMNETRGTDSCGLGMDGSILKGVKELSKYRDFGAFYRIEQPLIVPSVIGHTRKSTIGANTLYNAHPFGFGKIDIKGIKGGGFEFIGAHNGTLLNHKELALSRGISLKKTVTFKIEVPGTKKFKIEEREVDKIDSELLLECLYKDKNFSVLSEYNGAAALMWTNLNNPNVVYYYHGKSKHNEDSEELTEERPLYYWIENKNSLYISSISDSLFVIGGDGDDVVEFNHNVVYEVTNGNIKTAKKYSISREKRYQKENYYSRNNSVNDYKNTNNHIPFNNIKRPPFNSSNNINSSWIHGKNYTPPIGSAEQLLLNLQAPVDTSLINEDFDIPQETMKGLTQMKQLRYYRNGHLATGIYIYIKNEGFFFVGYTKKNAVAALKLWAGNPFKEGSFIIGKTTRKDRQGNIPLKSDLVNKNPDSYLHYMHEGIRYKNELDWKSVVNDSNSSNRFGIIELSLCSAHPIINVNKNNNQSIGAYYKGELFSGIVNPLGSNKNYSFRFGQLNNISYVKGKVPDTIIKSKTHLFTLDSAISFLEQSAKDDKLPNKKVESLNVAVEDLEKENNEAKLNKILLDHFINNFDAFPSVLRELNKIKSHSDQAQVAYNTVQDFLKGCAKIVELGENLEKNKK